MDELLPPDREGQSQNQMSASRVDGPVAQTGPVYGNLYIGGPSSDRVPVPRQLPVSATHFTDHEFYLDMLDHMVDVELGKSMPWKVPVALVTGLGGMGKTALSTHWAHRVSHQFKDGQLFCDLRGSSEGSPVEYAVVAESLLQVLGVSPARIPVDPGLRTAALRTELAKRKVLFVLDNAASSAQVRPLIGGGPGSVVIVTSRNPLSDLRVHHDAQHIRLDIFQAGDAVKLLRRLMMAGGRREDDEDLAELARLCANLPLALRMVAAYAVSQPGLALARILEDLRDAATRWETLSTEEGEAIRAIFDWSYRRLAPDVAQVFRLVGLHAGPEISLGAAAAAAGLPSRLARRKLYALTQAHLLEPSGEDRYRQHNLLQEYAVDLEGEVDGEAGRRETISRIVRWYTATAQNATEVLLPGRAFELDTTTLGAGLEPAGFETEDAAYEWFEAERPNLVASAQSALEAGLPRRAWELALVLSPLHASYFTFDDWSVLSEFALTAAGQTGDPVVMASALDNRGRFLLRRGKSRDAEAMHRRALALQEKARHAPGICRSLNALGLVRLQTRDLTAAIEYFENAMNRSARSGQPRWLGAASLNLADALLESGQLTRASDLLKPLPEFFADRHDMLNVGTSYQLIARASRLRRDPAAAKVAIERALQIAVEGKKPVWEANWLIEAARVHLARGEVSEAERHCGRSISLQRRVGDLGREASALDCMSEILLRTDREEEAAEASRQAAELRERQCRDLA